MKVGDHFTLNEFVPQKVINMLGAERAYYLIDPRLYRIADGIRRNLGVPIHIITDTAPNRGWRPMFTKVGSKRSFHKLGMAIDICSPELSAKEIYVHILKEEEYYHNQLGIRRLEDISYTPSWVHIDVADTDTENILIIKP